MSGLQKMRSFLSAILNDYFWLKTSFFQYLLIVCSRPPDECLACFGCRSWDVFGPDWNISNSFTWIMVPEDDVFGFSEMSWQLLNILSLNTVQTFEARGFVILTLTFCVPHWSHIPSLPTLCSPLWLVKYFHEKTDIPMTSSMFCVSLEALGHNWAIRL